MWSAAVLLPALPGSQQPGQRFPIGDLRTVQKRQQRVMTQGLLPGRGRASPCCRNGRCVMVASISICSHSPGAGAAPPAHAAARACARAARIPGRCAASMRSSTSRHIVVVGRRGAEGVFPIPAPLPDAVDAVRPGGHRRGQIGEHRTRLIHPRTSIRVGQRGGDLRRQARSDPPPPAACPSRHATRHHDRPRTLSPEQPLRYSSPAKCLPASIMEP